MAPVALLGAAVGLVLALAADNAAAQSSIPYARAVKLGDEGKMSVADSELLKARGMKRGVNISATVFIVSDKLLSDLGTDVRNYVFPVPDDPNSLRVNVKLPGEEESKWSLQVTPRSEEQVSLLNDTIRRNANGTVASLFGMRVLEMQQVMMDLIPDRKFSVIGQDGKPQVEMVRDRDKIVKQTKLMSRDILIEIRPVFDDNGTQMWLRFFDKSRPFDPYPPTSLSQSIGWSFPGNRSIVLGPPEYEYAAGKGAIETVKMPATGHLMISGIMAIGGERVRQGLPILDMIPVVGEAVFSSESTVHCKISVYVLLDVSPAR